MAQRRKKRSFTGQLFYDFRYRAGEYALRGLVTVLPWIPYRWVLLLTSLCARAAFLALWKYRVRMQQNVAQALGQQISTPAARKRLVWRAWRNFARGVLETTAVMHLSNEQIISAVSLEGEEHLKRARARGRGVIALSAHLGSFTMIGARLAASGYPFSVVVKQPAHEKFARLVDAYRAQIGIATISAKPRREAVRGILKALRENRVVLVIADEFKSGGVMVEFMGKLSAAPRGPAALALRTGAVTLPMFAIRRPDGSLVLSIGPEIEPVQVSDVEQSVALTTALFTRHIEQAIRSYPDQWNWLGFPRDGRVSRAAVARRRARAAEQGRATATAPASDGAEGRDLLK